MTQFNSSINNPFQVNNVMPDYGAGISKKLGIEYTAETDGYIIFECRVPDDKAAQLFLNGTRFEWYAWNTTGVDTACFSAQFVIPKNTKYKITKADNYQGFMYFFPCKGAI